MDRVRRNRGVAAACKQVADPGADVLSALLRAIPGDDLRSVRDWTVLVPGMAGTFPRLELGAL